MNILFLGDLVGQKSILYIKKNLENIKNKYKIDFVIVNGENVLYGYGITTEFADELLSIGVDVISSGNHIFDQKEIIPYLGRNKKVLKPFNLSTVSAGNGYGLFKTTNGKNILVINLMCNLFMKKSDNIFHTINLLLNKYILKKNCDAILIDLHGEVASEKQAFANFIDGRVSAVIGTHTHVPTSDLRILPNGTAYQTDAGMCGDYDSVIGGDKNAWIEKFLDNTYYKKIETSSKGIALCGAIIKICDKTGLSSIVKQLILGDTIENKIPNEKIFL